MTRCLVPSLLILGCAGPHPPPTSGTVLEEVFISSLVEGEYLLRIRQPPDMDPTKSHPLVIQLDPTFVGLEQFEWTAGLISERETSGSWPDSIVVGIDYGPDPGAWAGRERDYLPALPLDDAFAGDGADRFYRVLADEILPHLEATQPIDPGQRVLVGHSNGGVFAWYTAFRSDHAEPPLFAGIVAADAGIAESLFTLERWYAERADDLAVRLYASHALYNGAVQDVTFNGLTDRLVEREYPSLQLKTERLDTDHGGAVGPSFENGLDHVFEGLE